MEDEKKFIIGKRILKRSDFFKEEETREREATTLSFEEKIKILIDLQNLHTNGAEKISSSGKSKLFIHQPITPAGCEKGVDAKKVCVIDKRRWDFIIFA